MTATLERPLQCPECGSGRLNKAGQQHLEDGSIIQRWLCRTCGVRFRQNRQEQLYHRFKSDLPYINARGVNETSAEVDNLAAVENQSAARISPNTSPDIKGKLIEYAWYMEKNAYAPGTIRSCTGALRALLERKANLLDPESVKEALTKEEKWSPNRRRNVINAYTLFLKLNKLSWEKPRCTVVRKIPFIPTEAEIDAVIAGCPTIIATFLQLLKETAMRSGEAIQLEWRDIDLERHIITCNNPEKNSNARMWNNPSGKLLGMLNALPRTNTKVFGDASLNSMKATYTRARKRLAFKLQNPRLLEIHFHTMRHWRGTMEYHYTKDLMHVKQFLGHKETRNTEIYIQLDQNLFSNLPNDEFIIRAANTVDEAVKLGEVGFEPFVVMDGVQLFRKRK